MRSTKPILFIALAVAIIFASTYTLSVGRGAAVDDEDRRGDLIDQEPANAADLTEAVQQTALAVDREHWDEANHQIQQLRQKWTSYKPGMRAGAGTRMWPTGEIRRFEDTLATAEGAVSRQHKTRARDALFTMEQLIRDNGEAAGGPMGRR